MHSTHEPGHESAITRQLAVLLASCLGGLVCAVAVPLAWPKASWLIALCASVGMAAWPLIVGARWRAAPQLRPPQDRSIWQYSMWQYSGLLLSALLSPWAHSYFHPLLRVLNLTGGPLTVLIDGQVALSLPATSSESPLAGAELHPAAGSHQFSARNAQGTVLSQINGRLIAGATHLYAPSHNGQCFWLETAHYGSAGSGVDRVMLSPDEQFWLLSAEVDFWFVPPPASPGDSRLSGGAVTALRQGPCPAADDSAMIAQ